MTLPRLPDPEDYEPPPTEEAQNAATCLAMFLLLTLTVGLAFLVGMIFPTGFFILLLLAAAAGFFGFHYLVWGRLLKRMHEEPEEDEAAANETHSQG